MLRLWRVFFLTFCIIYEKGGKIEMRWTRCNGSLNQGWALGWVAQPRDFRPNPNPECWTQNPDIFKNWTQNPTDFEISTQNPAQTQNFGFGLGFYRFGSNNPAQTKNSGFGLGFGSRSQNRLGFGFIFFKCLGFGFNILGLGWVENLWVGRPSPMPTPG